MQYFRTTVLGDVFAAVDVLTVPARLRLMELVAVPGHAPAVLPRQLCTAPLPTDRDALAAIRPVIEDGLERPALTVLAAHRLDAVVPHVARCDLDLVLAHAPPRVRASVLDMTSGCPLGEYTIGQISAWRGFGPYRVSQLIGAAVAAAIDSAHRVDVRLAFLDEAIAAGGDARDRAVFENVVLPLGPQVTKPELAHALGISVDRVRRLAARASERVAAAQDQAPAAVRQLVAAMPGMLGTAAPLTAVDMVLADEGLPGLPDTRSRLLLWMAGPYGLIDERPGWVALDASEIHAETAKLIQEDQGVRTLAHLVTELHQLGVTSDHADEWLAGLPVRVSHGLAVAITGSPADVAERALHALGRPMSAEELSQWVPGGTGDVEALWSTRDRRFRRTTADTLALVEWGEDADGACA